MEFSGIIRNRKENSDMKQARFTEAPIVIILKEVEGRRAAKDACREQVISERTYPGSLRNLTP
jgi:hypothetical protein